MKYKKFRLIDNVSLMQEWDYKKNNSINLHPELLTTGMAQRAFWICSKCGNEWMSSIAHRASGDKPTGCPKCSAKIRAKKRQKNLQKKSNITITHPELLKEWDYEKNEISPESITKGSEIKVFWKCDKGHSWNTIVANRIKGHGCPFCSGRLPIRGINDLETRDPLLASEWCYEKNGDLRPDMVKYGTQKKVWWRCKYGHEWQATVSNRYKKRGCPICSKYRITSLPEKAIAYYLSKGYKVDQNVKILDNQMELDLFLPQLNLAIEYDGSTWHQNSERDLIKDEYCNKKGIFLIRIREEGCPDYITNARIIKTSTPDSDLLFLNSVIEHIIREINVHYGLSWMCNVNLQRDYYDVLATMKKYNLENSFAQLFPNLLKEWDYEKNGNVNPETITAGSSRRVWWKCKQGHEWRAAVANRTNISNRNKCPYCQGKKTIIGKNDIVTLGCSFLVDWDYEKNRTPPEFYMRSSGKKVWWKCAKCGFEWEAAIYSRKKPGCRNCNRKEAGYIRSRSVKNADTKEVFFSAEDAAKKYNIQAAAIRRVCSKERETAGGYHWEYTQELNG